MSDIVLEPRGPFSLAASARFIAGRPPATAVGSVAGETGEAVVRAGFLVDDWSGCAGVVLRQDEADDPVSLTVVDSTARDVGRVVTQAARVVSLDHDGHGWGTLGRRDPVIGARQDAAGWLRPVLFHSPYEAACWAIVSARTHPTQAAGVRAELSRVHGAALDVGGERFETFPAPERLLAVTGLPGLNDEKLRRLHGIAEAALEGRLDRERLLALPDDEALGELERLRGIGPFWASLILLRAVGPTDALSSVEPRVRAPAAAAYGEPDVAGDDAAFARLAERWRPFRTWAMVLLRSTA